MKIFSRVSYCIKYFYCVYNASMVRFIKVANPVNGTENKLFIREPGFIGSRVWSELGMNWEAGVGANWECIGRRGLERTGNVLGGGVGANWE